MLDHSYALASTVILWLVIASLRVCFPYKSNFLPAILVVKYKLSFVVVFFLRQVQPGSVYILHLLSSAV